MAPAPPEGGDGHGTGAVPITRVQRAFRPDSRVADLGYLTQRHKVVTLAEGRRTAGCGPERNALRRRPNLASRGHQGSGPAHSPGMPCRTGPLSIGTPPGLGCT